MTKYKSRILRIAAIIPVLMGVTAVLHAQTPPIQPNIQQTPLPPKVELPAPPDPAPDVPNRPLTADEAAAIALYRQPAIAAARAGILAAQGRVQQSQAGLYPIASTGASYTNTPITPSVQGGSNTVSTATSSGYQITANLRQLLYDFEHTRDLVRQANALRRSANANLGRVQSDTVFAVKQAFYAYAQDQRLVSVNESNLRNQQNHLASAQARLDSGLGLPADVVRAQTAVADATLSLTLARNNASVAQVNLAELMGIDPRTPIETADKGEPAVAVNDVNALVDQALHQRPDIQQTQSNVQAAQLGVNAAKSSDRPSLGANVGWLQRGSNFPPDKNTLTYGVAIQWAPFDGGLTKGRVKEAQAGLQASQAQLDTARQTVISDVSQAYINLRTAEQRVITADAEVANAEESLRLIEGRYSSGLGTFLDVLDAQNALLTAKTNRVNAQSAVDVARAAMSHATGANLPSNISGSLPK